jgi:hypothetical protein
MVETGSHESNDDTPIVTGNIVNTSKSKVTGQKWKRYCFTDVQTTFLEVQLERIHTWFRNQKNKKKGGGQGGEGGSESKKL